MLKGRTLPRISRLALSFATPTLELGPYIFILSILANSSEIMSPHRFPESIMQFAITDRLYTFILQNPLGGSVRAFSLEFSVLSILVLSLTSFLARAFMLKNEFHRCLHRLDCWVPSLDSRLSCELDRFRLQPGEL